ncbi:hypothetical protein MNEG_13334 [Monoraphidium neglectum]|uniref:C2H2-type domain-containing protein n=1 Tax=Monoraphidium neglectum TaxID=145388 RepID=A0A0D2LSN0_9CHLO|nr:hypothetical protein MNEG_13334 [Monoraphidium neglectum]KIY94629.1 hypothetical protein MNEG_13334 [Monoraphidium neglectum]|eukprot:XP_013893649.1 hypothetical protein MNEG_13334 [Monoraphidium neglectum]
MATSLVCKQCDTLLKDVKEAQAHNDITGHTQFEESTQKVPRLVCAECGKVCRSDVERAMHSRGTGHKEFVDKTDEAEVIDTEQQMAAAKQELKEDLEADAELLGVKRKKAAPAQEGASAAAGAGGDGAEAMAVDEEMRRWQWIRRW